MSYRTDISGRDRGGAIAAVVAIHAALAFLILHSWSSGGRLIEFAAPPISIFDLKPPVPPPPPPPPPEQPQQPKPKDEAGGSAPNIRSEATPIKAPEPKVILPPLPQIAVSETPREGTAPTQGAAPVPGPGTGTGGSGTGTGTGSGAGAGGGGGDGGVADPPHLVSPVLTGRDFPRALLEQWPRAATIFMRLRVDARGYVSECTVDRGTGVAAIDAEVCNIAHDRLRFRPALNRRGQAVAGWFGYAQRAPR